MAIADHTKQSEGRTQKSSSFKTVSSFMRSLLSRPRRFQIDPPNYLYFPYMPRWPVPTAFEFKNTSESRVAFKFEAPKGYTCESGGIIEPGETLMAMALHFPPRKLSDQKNKMEFKIMSLKVKEGVDYEPKLFEERKYQVTVEQVLGVAYFDPKRPSPTLDEWKRRWILFLRLSRGYVRFVTHKEKEGRGRSPPPVAIVIPPSALIEFDYNGHLNKF